MYVQETLYSICGNISFVCPGMNSLKIIITMLGALLKPIDGDNKKKRLVSRLRLVLDCLAILKQKVSWWQMRVICLSVFVGVTS